MTALTVQNAEIKTAAVEIRTLTISGKQVTLAVFRQLIEEALIGETGEFAGQPWGTVNYHPDKTCASVRSHRHVVWQKGVELRRARIDSPAWYGDQHAFWPESGCDFVQRAYCAAHHRLPGWADRRKDPTDGDWSVFYEVGRLLCASVEPDDPYRGGEPHECSAEDVTAELLEEVEAEKSRRTQVRIRWREIEDLPQLFIAV